MDWRINECIINHNKSHKVIHIMKYSHQSHHSCARKEKLFRCYTIPIEKTPKERFRNSHSDMFLGKDVLEICSKFTGEHLCRSVILIKLHCNFTEITLQHGHSPVNMLHTFRTPFVKNTSEWLLLNIISNE